MWMATNDNGLALVAYGPSVVKAKVANGKDVTITEETDYPFKGLVKLTIKSEKRVKFPLSIRIPSWAGETTIKYKDITITGKGGSEQRIEANWKNGDQITIEIPMEIRSERRYNNSMSILRGPLYFSLRIDKEFKSVKINYDNFAYKGSVDWEITPKSPWNFGLVLDPNNIARGLKVMENPVGKYPFSDKGDMIWSADSGKYIASFADAPLVLTARGMRIPEWEMKDNSADNPPLSPVKPQGSTEVITLVPYGCARLRITEFPVMDVVMMEDILKPAK
jgi:uncharacterized protein